jgi:hypothetical protein
VVDVVADSGNVHAIVVRSDFRRPGISFFTPSHFPQQLGLLCHAQGHVVPPHTHLPAAREIAITQEVLIIRSGRVRVDVYNAQRQHLAAVELGVGDVILLAEGGHGLTMLEDSEITEVKQGPYDERIDKVRFDPPAAPAPAPDRPTSD